MPACAEFGAWYPRFNSFHMHTPWVRYQLDMAELFSQRLQACTRAWCSGEVLCAPTHFGGLDGDLHRCCFRRLFYVMYLPCKDAGGLRGACCINMP